MSAPSVRPALVYGLLAVLPALSGCGGFSPSGLRVGGVLIPRSELELVTRELRHSFPQFGEATLHWSILDGGWGPAWLLHEEHPEASAAALAEARRYQERLEQGEDFLDLVRERKHLAPGVSPLDLVRAPNPETLGGRVAAKVATLKPGEWAGPLRTARGWELIFLSSRQEGLPASRAGVQLARLVFPVGSKVDHAQAFQDWVRLPLSGDPDLIRDLPSEFRRDRVRTPNS